MTSIDGDAFSQPQLDQIRSLLELIHGSETQEGILKRLQREFGLDMEGREEIKQLLEENKSIQEFLQSAVKSCVTLREELQVFLSTLPTETELAEMKVQLGIAPTATTAAVQDATLELIMNCLNDIPRLVPELQRRLQIQAVPTFKTLSEARETCGTIEKAIARYKEESKRIKSQEELFRQPDGALGSKLLHTKWMSARDKAASAATDNTALRAAAADAEGQVKVERERAVVAEAQNTKLANTNENLKAQLSTVSNSCDEALGEVQQLKQQADTAYQEIKDIKKSFSEHLEHHKALQAQLQAGKEEHERNMALLQTNSEQFSQQLRENAAKITDLQNESASFITAIPELEKSLQNVESRNAELAVDLQQKIEEASHIQTQSDKFARQRNAESDKLRDVESELLALKHKLTETQSKLVSAVSERDRYSHLHSKVHARLGRRDARIGRQSSSMSNLRRVTQKLKTRNLNLNAIIVADGETNELNHLKFGLLQTQLIEKDSELLTNFRAAEKAQDLQQTTMRDLESSKAATAQARKDLKNEQSSSSPLKQALEHSKQSSQRLEEEILTHKADLQSKQGQLSNAASHLCTMVSRPVGDLSLVELTKEVESKLGQMKVSQTGLQQTLDSSEANLTQAKKAVQKHLEKESRHGEETDALQLRLSDAQTALSEATTKNACIPAYRNLFFSVLDFFPGSFDSVEFDQSIALAGRFYSNTKVKFLQQPDLTVLHGLSSAPPKFKSLLPLASSVLLQTIQKSAAFRPAGVCDIIRLILAGKTEQLAQALSILYAALIRIITRDSIDQSVKLGLLLIMHLLCTFTQSEQMVIGVKEALARIATVPTLPSPLTAALLSQTQALLEGRHLSLGDEVISAARELGTEGEINGHSFHMDHGNLVVVCKREASPPELAVLSPSHWRIELRARGHHRLRLTAAAVLGDWEGPDWMYRDWITIRNKVFPGVAVQPAVE